MAMDGREATGLPSRRGLLQARGERSAVAQSRRAFDERQQLREDEMVSAPP